MATGLQQLNYMADMTGDERKDSPVLKDADICFTIDLAGI
jgi:hypothetical protein